MIDFRYHLVSVAAIFLALAVGVALGAGPLQGPLAEGLVSQASDDRQTEAELRAELLEAQDRLEFGDDYAAGTAPAVLGDVLAGRTVSLIPLPGSDAADVRALRDQVEAAQGTVVSTVPLTAALLDPAQRTFAEGLAEKVLGGPVGARVPAAATSYQVVGAAFARAFLSRDEGAPPQDDDASTIEAALVEGGLVALDGEVDRRAQLALLVDGDPTADVPEGAPDVAAELAAAMDAASAGAVVAGPPGSAEAGAVDAVRRSRAGTAVSTVDVVGIPAGRAVAVLALAEQAAGGVGQYGQRDAEDGAVPDRPLGGSIQ